MEVERLYLLKRQVELEGKYLTDAKPSFDQFRKPIVNFQLTREGGRKFARLTGANINKGLAIVLDGRVESAPEIQSRIQDRGQITMGGTAHYEDANDLSIVLRAGALPAPVNVIENNVIGPSLGQDSINRGVSASLLGLAAVFLIMLVYYRLSGLIANLGLTLQRRVPPRSDGRAACHAHDARHRRIHPVVGYVGRRQRSNLRAYS